MESLIQRVLKNEWRPGEVLPSEARIASEYNVSQGTVRKALEALASDNIVTRRQGKGTFVATHRTRHEPFRFYRIATEQGKIAPLQATWDTEYLSCEQAAATRVEQRNLGLGRAARVARIRRLRKLNGEPMIMERIAIRTDLCGGVARIVDRLRPESIYLALEQHCGILIVRVEERVRAIECSREDARLLRLSAGTPILEVERTAYSLDATPIEWRTMRCHTGRLHYFNEIR